MTKVIGIYNNKGGVGKTTLTLFLADFLSAITINRKRARVLVLDFDPQGSCASAILGAETVNKITKSQLTLSNAFLNKLKGEDVDWHNYVHTRSEAKSDTKKTKVGKLDVMLSDPVSVLEFDQEANASLTYPSIFSAKLLDEMSKDYDFIFVDFPGNLSKINTFCLIGAFMVSHFLIPVEPNRINANALQGTVDMLNNLKAWRSRSKFKVLGLVLNKSDRRTKQYRDHNSTIEKIASDMGCKIYENILPPTPKLADATDDSIEFFTLSDKYNSYYNHVRKLVIEFTTDLGFNVRKI